MTPNRRGHMASYIGRRKFLATLGGTAAWPLAVHAQQPERMRRIGVLMSLAHDDRQGRRYIAAFLNRLQELGWKDGPGLAIDVRWGAADLDHIRSYATELATVKPNVILAQSALALTPIQRVTDTIPIVFVQVFDPVGSGFVDSLARPGGNTTGFADAEFSMSGNPSLGVVVSAVAPRDGAEIEHTIE